MKRDVTIHHEDEHETLEVSTQQSLVRDGDYVRVHNDDTNLFWHNEDDFQEFLGALVEAGIAAFGQEAVEAALNDSGVQTAGSLLSQADRLTELLRRPVGVDAAIRDRILDAVAEDRDFTVEQPEFEVVVTPPPQIVVNNHFSHTVINEA